ncbi:MAG: hypothetical protein WCO72_03370 [Betaproteobacteria bacterium]
MSQRQVGSMIKTVVTFPFYLPFFFYRFYHGQIRRADRRGEVTDLNELQAP